MKKIIKNILIFSSLVVVFAACKKDENRITYEGGTPPVLTPSSLADLVLTKATSTRNAISFTWTNPDYQFTTGLSSQDVTYYLQVDTAGSGFTTPGNTSDIAIANELSVDLTDSVLNRAIAHITDTGLVVDVPHNIEIRLKSTLRGSSVPLYSNVISLVVTPYLDVAVPIPVPQPGNAFGDLYLVGSATPGGWNNPVDANIQQFTRVSATMYEITLPLIGGQFYLFLPVNGSWTNKYAVHDKTLTDLNKGGDFGYNGGNSFFNDDIPGPSVNGTYKIVVNFITGKFTVTKL